MRRGFLSGASAGSRGACSRAAETASERVASAYRALSEAERQLRRLRAERLKDETNAGHVVDSRPTGKAPEVEGLPEFAALEALISHAEPPPPPLHRLGEALTLLLEAPMLVELGEHPLPGHVPWKNVQALLSKPWPMTDGAPNIATALAQRPFGTRLVDNVRHRIFGGSLPLSRADIETADSKCSSLFEWVLAVLGGDDAAEGRPLAAASRTDEAIATQEKEVARLRRRVREVEQSENAATDFAAKRAPQATSQEASLEARTAPTTRSGRPSDTEAYNSSDRRFELQYRLNEVTVPMQQEGILISVANAITDERAGIEYVELAGFAEEREDIETAERRAGAVQNWLMKNGVDQHKLRIANASQGERWDRRVELRLVECVRELSATHSELLRDQLSDASLRLHAEKVLTGLGPKGASEVVGEAHLDTSPTQGAELLQSPVTDAGADLLRSPVAKVEEVNVDVDGNSRLGWKIVFTLPGLAAADTSLDVSERTVRLSSHSGAWSPVEVPLPVNAAAPTEKAACFSRKRGTLTLQLWALDA